MGIQLLNALTASSVENGTKGGAAGNKPQGDVSFSAVLADRSRTDARDTNATTIAKDAALKQGEASSHADRKTQPTTDASARDLLAVRHGTTDPRTANQPLTADREKQTEGRAQTKRLPDTRLADSSTDADLTIAEAETEGDSDKTVFADISWNAIAVPLQHGAAGATTTQTKTTHATVATAATDTQATAGKATGLVELQSSIPNAGQLATAAADGAPNPRTLDARAQQTARKAGDTALRLTADSDGLVKQGEDALASDRVRIAVAAQNTNTDARAPAAWAAFAGDVFQPARGSRFTTTGTSAESGADVLDMKSLPNTTTAIQGAAGNSFAASTPPAALSASVNAPLGSEAWKQAINQQALRLSHVGDGAAELTLYPRELGQLHVSLKMGEHAQLHFASAHADVRAAVEAALPQLRHAFAESGINLGQTSVSDQGTNPNSSNDNGSGRAQGRTTIADTGDVATADTLTAPVAVTTLAGRTLDGGIDIFA